jgi:hypothetical protein
MPTRGNDRPRRCAHIYASVRQKESPLWWSRDRQNALQATVKQAPLPVCNIDRTDLRWGNRLIEACATGW